MGRIRFRIRLRAIHGGDNDLVVAVQVGRNRGSHVGENPLGFRAGNVRSIDILIAPVGVSAFFDVCHAPRHTVVGELVCRIRGQRERRRGVIEAEVGNDSEAGAAVGVVRFGGRVGTQGLGQVTTAGEAVIPLVVDDAEVKHVTRIVHFDLVHRFEDTVAGITQRIAARSGVFGAAGNVNEVARSGPNCQ